MCQIPYQITFRLLGLGIGLACYLMIALFVKHEWAYDRFHENEGELMSYRVSLRVDQVATLPEVICHV